MQSPSRRGAIVRPSPHDVLGPAESIGASTLSVNQVQPTDDFVTPLDAVAGWSPGQRGAVSAPYQVLDLFSGCGGMSLGFASVGVATGSFELVGAVDINAASLSTYRKNFQVPALEQDVAALAASSRTLRDVTSRIPTLDRNRPLVLIGCAPCQGFTAHRKRNWDEKDDRNDLVTAFAKVAVNLDAECIVMENVPELLSGRYWPYFEGFRERLEQAGYLVKAAIHNSAHFGVPQERFRAVVIAMKSQNFSLPQAFVPAEDFKTVRDAIGDLPPVRAGQICESDPLHRSAAHRASTLEVIRSVPKDGGSRPSGVGPACLDRVDGFYDVYGRLSWNRPSITITHYARNSASGRFTHPEQDRGLTVREASRLQGFPDSFAFEGSFDDKFRQIGEAVPPPMAAAIALSVCNGLNGGGTVGAEPDLVMSPVSDSFAGVIAGIKRRPR
jgi:DNA (cytosine-5)-methyltransferase 1